MVRPGEKAGGRSEGAPGAFPRAGLRNITEPRLKSGPSSNLNEYTESVRRGELAAVRHPVAARVQSACARDPSVG